MDRTAAGRPASQSGFSLVETMIAGAILGVVLIAILSMFILGGQFVKSGKELTKATGLGIEMMEDFRRLDFDSAYKVIGGGCGETTRSWRSEIGSWNDPPNIGIPNTPPPADCDRYPSSGWSWPVGDEGYKDTLCRWAIVADRQFPSAANGAVRVKVDGFNAIPASNNASRDGDVDFCQAKYLRVRVTVEWSERTRRRDVTFETLKF